MRVLAFLLCMFGVSGLVSGQTNDYQTQARSLVAQMTLEEKASLCSGLTAWTTKPIERLGIPSIFMTDGPHGLRKAEGFDFTNSVPSTCFPTAPLLAATWDTKLVEKVGVALGRECQTENVHILLGPGVNIKRSPLGGRNFEYFSEDPLLSGKMAVALIHGVQSEGVGTSLKHFAANNQEFERMTMNAVLDERTLHEIYLPAFEMAVREAQPWTVMCSYNRVNGIYASENPYLLTEVLRRQWGFQGFVVSDWGAVNNRIDGVKAGLHLEMPASGGLTDKKVVEAVRQGHLAQSRLDSVATELLAVILRAQASHLDDFSYDAQQHHALAREVSAAGIVLLKNNNKILPLRSSLKRLALIGAFAKTPRYQGSGSSRVRVIRLDNAYDELQKLLPQTRLDYAPGYSDEGAASEQQIAEAVRLAKTAEVAIVFAGLPDSYESEGFDRRNLDLPAGHNRLIDAVLRANPRTVVVLMNGSAVAMPWADRAPGIVEGWLGGQAGGGALADVLTGRVNPSGKLSETFPMRLQDTPTALDFPAMDGDALYGEGLFIGYRYYDKQDVAPLFPFGFGLSYTTFAYSDLRIEGTTFADTARVTLQFTVKNTGTVAGQEVAQLYVHDQTGTVSRPENELKRFAKIALKPGEQQTVTFRLGYRDFAWYDARLHDWRVSDGRYDLRVGGSSRSLPLSKTITLQATRTFAPPLTLQSMLKEFKNHPRGQAFYQQIVGNMVPPGMDSNSEEAKKLKAMMELFLSDMPVSKLAGMSNGKLSEEMLQQVLFSINGK